MSSRDLLKELKEYLEERIANLKRELELLEYMLSLIESGALSMTTLKPKPLAGERVEEVKRGRNVLASIFVGKDYVRMVPFVEIRESSPAIREYLSRVVEELREAEGAEGEPVEYSVVSDDKGVVREIVIKNVRGELQLAQVRAALRFIVERQYEEGASGSSASG